MLTLIVKSKNRLGFEPIQNSLPYQDYIVVIYINNIRQCVREPSLTAAFRCYPKGHWTTVEKLQMVEAVFAMTGETEGLDEYWKTL